MTDPLKTKSYDQSGKYLSDRDPVGFLQLLGAIGSEEVVEIEVVDRELLTPSRAVDRLYRVRDQDRSRLVHGEFQARWKHLVPWRVTDYGARIYLLTNEPVESYVLLLTDDPAPPRYPPPGVIQVGDLTITKGYKLICLWEQDADEWLAKNRPYILPLVPLMRGGGEKLSEVAGVISATEDEGERKELAAYFAVMSGLKYDRSVIDRILEDAAMQIPMEQLRESSVAQAWLLEGFEEGLEKGIEKGREEGRAAAIHEMFRRAAARYFPLFDPGDKLERVTDLEALEDLCLTMHELPGASALGLELDELVRVSGQTDDEQLNPASNGGGV